jgi:hypothetical protein
MKAYIYLLLLVIFAGCSKNRYRTNVSKKIVTPPEPPVNVIPKQAPEVPEALKVTKSKVKQTTKAKKSNSGGRRSGITYSELFDEFTISGAGKYGMVYIQVKNIEILGGVEISGSVDGNMIFLNGSFNDILDSISLSGSCGDFGFAVLEVQLGGFLNQASLTGNVGDNFVNYTVSGVSERTNKLYVITKLIALLFDAE